ncbi:MAG: type I glutamate--ammonia ligase [Thermoplasmatales archaeon]|nr:type I glutamate--ammonia ligase [Thermoplasmatales archaeon]
MHSKDDVLEEIEKEKVKFIQMTFTDILGTVKNVTIPSEKLGKAVDEGIFFDGSSVLGYATIEESDMRLVPDPGTFLILPWTNNDLKTARFLCNIYDSSGKRFEGDPRYVLENVVRKAKEMGHTANAGPEYEFFLLNLDEKGSPVPKPSDSGGYFDLMRDRGDSVRKEIVMYLNKMGFDVEASHHEVAPGQHEIDLTYSDIVTSADRVTMMKYVTKTIALRHALYATFMPKPIFGENGSGMHVHLSLVKKGENVFYEKKGRHGLSKNAFYFLGGLLKYAKETCAVLASCVNSYKRLVPGYEAPVYISWANRNRSALIRVPAGREMKTRVEVRNPDPAGNPYLQFAVMLASGLKGMEEKIVPPEPVEKDIYRMTNEERKKLGIGSLPSNLGEALYYMNKSSLVKEIIGEHLFKHYLYIKHKEWDDYRTRVTDWEIEKLLPIL